jgi:hypothetical protein
MICPQSKLLILKERIRLFNLNPSKEERSILMHFLDEIDHNFSDSIDYSLNFFNDGGNIFGEVFIENEHKVLSSRQMGTSILNVTQSIRSDLIKRSI